MATPSPNIVDALQKQVKSAYDFIIVGSGSSGSVIAGELANTGAEVLLVEAGGLDNIPTISNPSIWFYNIGGDFDWHLPIQPVPQLNNRNFNLALGHGVGGGSSINAMVWSRGMERDYDGWANKGAKGWAFKDVLPMFKAQEDWEGGANKWRGVGGPVHIASRTILTPRRRFFWKPPVRWVSKFTTTPMGPCEKGPATST
jgi:choline dehydrogenase